MIYICFGMTKSASTFLYQLTEETLRAAGRKPARLGPPFCPRWRVENYIDDIDPALLEAIAVATGGRDVVLKTHQGLHPEVARQIDARSLLASASIRDPREIALAMVDHGADRAAGGDTEFAECRTVFDAWPSLDNQIANFCRWSELKTLEVFRYNEICFDSATVVARIATQIGVAIDAATVLRPFRGSGRIGQFNKGAALRYRGCRRMSSRRFSIATPGSTTRSGSIRPLPKRSQKPRTGSRRAPEASSGIASPGYRGC